MRKIRIFTTELGGSVNIKSNELLGTEISFITKCELVVEMIESNGFNDSKEFRNRR